MKSNPGVLQSSSKTSNLPDDALPIEVEEFLRLTPTQKFDRLMEALEFVNGLEKPDRDIAAPGPPLTQA